MNKKGFTLIELLIVSLMTGIVLSAVYVTYTRLYSGAKQLSKITESNIENIMSSEMIRIDIGSAGLGLGKYEETSDGDFLYPVGWDNETKALQIFTTYDRAEPRSYGWIMLKCEEQGTECELVDSSDTRESTHFSGLKAIDSLTGRLINFTEDTVSASDYRYAIGYPYDSAAEEQFRTISYYMADTCDNNTRVSSRCAPGTSLICRGNVAMVDCAAGFAVYGGYEENQEIIYDTLENIIDDDPKNLLTLRRLVLHILVQEGQFDRGYNFGDDVITKNLDFDIEGDPMDQITFDIPPDGRKYRWNILTIDARTVNIGDKYESQQ